MKATLISNTLLRSSFCFVRALIFCLSLGLMYSQVSFAQNDKVPKNGLVASYTFDNDKDGIVVDNSGKSHGKAMNVEYEDGVVGRAASFNGVDSKIIISNADGSLPKNITELKQGTVSFWIKFENLGGQVLPILYLGKKDSSMPSRSMIFELGHDRGSIDNRRLYFTSIISKGNNFCVDSGQNLQEGKWYHYVAVVGDRGSTIYLNGVEISTRRYNLGSTSKSSVFFDDTPNKELLSIGYGRYSQEDPFFSFNGLVDDMLIYDRALSGQEVIELFKLAGIEMGSPELGYIDAASMEGQSPIERVSKNKESGNRSKTGGQGSSIRSGRGSSYGSSNHGGSNR